MTLLIKMTDMHFYNKVRFNAFYVIMKRVSMVTNFKPPIYQRFN